MDEQEKKGRCGWVALALTVFLLEGLLPVSFIGGAAGLKTAEMFGQPHSHLLTRLFVFAGMVLAVCVSGIFFMLLFAVIKRIVAVLFSPPTLLRLRLRRWREE